MTSRIFISGPEPLEAVANIASPTAGMAVIAAPHPLYGGALDNPVVQALATGIRARGFSTVCFNYRGVGASGGELTGDVPRAVEDYLRVLQWARAEAPTGKYIACGYSFGAATALEVALRGDQALDALLLVAPPAAMVDRQRLGALELPVHMLVGDSDSYLGVDAAREIAGCMKRCAITECEADHFFAWEIDTVQRFAASAL